MSDIQETELLAREAQLIFSNVTGWSMSGGSLRTWRGKVENIEFEIFLPRLFPEVPPVVRSLTPIRHPNVDADGRVSLRILENWRVEYHLYQVILQLLSLLKRNPAQVAPNNNYNYSRSSEGSQTGGTSFQQTSNQPEYQLQTKPIFPTHSKRSPLPSPAGTEHSPGGVSSEVAILRKELERLKEENTKKDEELTHIRAKEAIGVSGTTGSSSFAHSKTDDQTANLEAEQIAISELMANLDERHEVGEISTIEYSKLFKKYARDLFILNKKLEYVQSQQKKS
ncbi:MAG: ubiquitin-conjugating enzyme E2 variant [Candidatus Thorarchaeota archaeon]